MVKENLIEVYKYLQCWLYQLKYNYCLSGTNGTIKPPVIDHRAMNFAQELRNKSAFTCSQDALYQMYHIPLIPKANTAILPTLVEIGILQSRNASPTQDTKRRHVTSQQREALDAAFNSCFFPTTNMRQKLAKELKMTPRAIQVWFQNKRQAWRAKNRPSSK